ncbi:MAG TPA: hypothetical protein VGA30_09200, partial [Actinomycetota bacterium]
MTITPNSGQPLAQTEIRGTGFAPNERVALSFDAGHMDMGAEADEHGKFFAKRHVPFDALPGAHRVEALGQESGLRARTIFVMRTDWPQYRENDQGTGNKDFE